MANKSRGRGQISELTHIAPIKQGYIDAPADGSEQLIRYADRLRTILEAFHRREDQGFPSVIRLFRGLHTAQWALLDGDTRLMVNVVFDGTLHGYLRALARDIPGMLHMIWSNCQGWEPCYDDPDKLIEFIERHQVRVNFFYAQHPALTVPDVENLLRLQTAYASAASSQELQAQLYRANAPRSNAERLEGLLTKYGDAERSKQAFVGLFGSLYTAPELENAGRETYGGLVPKPEAVAAEPEREKQVQSNVLHAYEHAHCGRMLFFHFPKGADARGWLRERKEAYAFGRPDPIKPYLNIGFSYPGLAELGVDKAVLSGFPEAFAHGMDARADALGDPPPPSTEQAQRHWTKAFDPTKPVHAVVFVQCAPDRVADLQAELLAAGQAAQSQSLDGACSVAAATPGDVSRLSERLRADLQQQLDRVCADFGLDVSGTASSERPYLIGYQDLHRPLVQPERPGAAPYGVEYFGFRDGLGQPQLPKGALQVGSSGWLGERDSYDVVLRREPHGLLKNASFLVARQLRQHTDAFWDGMQARAQTLGIGKRELAEQIVGRRMDGRRLDSNQPHFDPVRDRHAFDPDRENPGCPFHSHVRRVNPRTETSAVRNPQLMRRSLAYSNKRAGADVKGLMFMAFNADLETQFELIQRNWIQAGNQVGLTSHDRDVLVGLEVPPQPHADSHPARFYADSKRELTFDHAFVELEWGIYLYFPAKDALFQL